MLYPLTFHPILKQRVWGGRNLQRLFSKPFVSEAPIGESWEISDRHGDASVVRHGTLAGKDLRWLMEHHRDELLGTARAQRGRFPLLIKILDASESLSLQVHPSPDNATALGGEPKTEMWYVAHAAPGAELFVGLRRGVTRADFERRIGDGTVAECFYRIAVRAGDAMFLPSGRVHAIGAGNVVFEIQQNSDTTYRVFDWNRAGLDGRPRALHIKESLESIDFNDFEPSLIQSKPARTAAGTVRPLADDPLFGVDQISMEASQRLALGGPGFVILGVLTGQATLSGGGQCLGLTAGQFCLIPASVNDAMLQARNPASFLRILPGRVQDSAEAVRKSQASAPFEDA